VAERIRPGEADSRRRGQDRNAGQESGELRIATPAAKEPAAAHKLKVTLEVGPKGKRVVALAPDWPGLERGAKTGEAAIEALQAYLPRFAKVAKLAGVNAEFAAISGVCVVETYKGTGSTDFWGIPHRGKMARNWPLPYLIRHTAYHTMDHAWEMEDKDLSGSAG
jgi:hypothetical protein